jgi:hypothetical protein
MIMFIGIQHNQLYIFTILGTYNPIIFYYINPNKMHMSQILFYLTIALHVLGVIIPIFRSTTTVTTASGNRYTVLLYRVYRCTVCVVAGVRHPQNFQLFHDSSRQQYGITVTRWCSYNSYVLLRMDESDARNT